MMTFLVITSLIFLAVVLGYSVYVEDKILNPPYIPETDSEKRIRALKLRIADATWKFRKEHGEV